MAIVASILVYTALTAMLFRGLLPDLTTHLASDLGDPLMIVSVLEWNAHHLPLTAAWWNFPSFAPLDGVTAFTEHFLLAYPLASPIIWVTGSSSAAFIGGLAFGFAPYFANHLSHLQLLLAFGMPLALLGLHRYLRTRRWRDAALCGAGWLATGLASAYTLVFFPLDDPFVNAAAQYRAVVGGCRTINGYSGYEAPHLGRLVRAFKDGQYSAIDTYRQAEDLYVIVRPEADPSFTRWLASQSLDRPPHIAGAAVYRLRSSELR